jgi:hypothetical protein
MVMMREWLFGYGGDSIDCPEAFVFVPEGMTTEEYISFMGSSLADFVKAVEAGGKAAEKGDLDEVATHLETITKLNHNYEEKGKALQGITKHNQAIMTDAILHHLKNGNTTTDKVRKYANKYNIKLGEIDN